MINVLTIGFSIIAITFGCLEYLGNVINKGKLVFNITFDGRSIIGQEKVNYDSKLKLHSYSYKFIPNREVQWLGYRDNNPISKAYEIIDINVWIAGIDRGSMVLGVSCSGAGCIYMNTIFVLENGKFDSYEIETGLRIVANYN